MQKGHILEFPCQECQSPVRFSVFSLEQHPLLSCPTCQKKYHFGEETLRRQLQKFAALCRQLFESEEILSQTAVGFDVGEHRVKIPFKLLLTRLNSSLELKIGEQTVCITFRIEPLHEGMDLLK